MLGSNFSLPTDISRLSQAQALTHPKQDALRHHALLLDQWLLEQSDLPPGVTTRIMALSCESSPRRFAEGLQEIARSYLKAGDFQTPVELYSLALAALPQDPTKDPNLQSLRENLQGQLNSLQGQGSFRDSLKLGLKRLPHEIFSPTVVAMGVGSLMNPLGTRLVGNLLRGSVGQTSRIFLSRAGGMFFDALGFTGVQQGVAIASGQPTHSFGHNLLHAGLILTSLRVTGTLARTTLQVQRIQRALNHFGNLTKRATEFSLPMVAEFHGILGARHLGAYAGLGPVGPHAGLETCFTMVHFRFAHSWLRLSPKYSLLHQNLQQETQNTLHGLGTQAASSLNRLIQRWGGPGGLGGNRLAYANGIPAPEAPSLTKSAPHVSYLNAHSASGSGRPGFQLRPYQEGLLDHLVTGIEALEHPWLGIISPMQTGKSKLIGPLIEEALELEDYQDATFLVVTYSRRANKQVYEDLVAQFGEEQVGRHGGKPKEKKNIRNPIVVIGSNSIVRNKTLQNFGKPKKLGWKIGETPTVIIHDEAFLSLSPGMKTVHKHFGLMDEHGKLKMGPKGGRVIGLAGTPDRSPDYYHIGTGGTYALASAWDDGYIRHVDAFTQRFSAQELDYETRTEVGGYQNIRWKLDKEEKNARALAVSIKKHVYDQDSKKSLIYVPTTEHAEVLYGVLKETIHGEAKNSIYRMHSGNAAKHQNDTALATWEQKGGMMIVVGMLDRSYRGNEGMPIDTIFMTYKTSSLELFSQRVGRGWAQDPESPLPDLRLIEVDWVPKLKGPQRKRAMANMMRLMGIDQDYEGSFKTREGPPKPSKPRPRRPIDLSDRAFTEAVRKSSLQKLFSKDPRSLNWAREISMALSDPDMTTEQYADEAGLYPEQIEAYRFGVLPHRWRDARALAPWVEGGEAKTRELWISAWNEALESMTVAGRRREQSFSFWQKKYGQQGATEEKALALDDYLKDRFRRSPFWKYDILGDKFFSQRYSSHNPIFAELDILRIDLGEAPTDRQVHQMRDELEELQQRRRGFGFSLTDSVTEALYHWRRINDAPKRLDQLAEEGREGLPVNSLRDLSRPIPSVHPTPPGARESSRPLTTLNDILHADLDQIPPRHREAWRTFMRDYYRWNIPRPEDLDHIPFPELPWKARYLLHLEGIDDVKVVKDYGQDTFEALGLWPEEVAEVRRILARGTRRGT